MVCTFCSVGLVFAPVTPKNTAVARSSNRPLFSMATMVLSKVGAAGLSAIAQNFGLLLRHARLDRGLDSHRP